LVPLQFCNNGRNYGVSNVKSLSFITDRNPMNFCQWWEGSHELF
jgi:hypothetical protein